MMNDFSRFPVPEVKSLPDDIRTVMETTEEKVFQDWLTINTEHMTDEWYVFLTFSFLYEIHALL